MKQIQREEIRRQLEQEYRSEGSIWELGLFAVFFILFFSVVAQW